ncbi:hypothetical protein MHK_000230, partial [Candidatus Magnetomorum sp. HK-1]
MVCLRTQSLASLIPDSNILISGTTTNRTLEITPVNNQTGESYITLTISDGNATFSRSFTVTVNSAPTISTIQNQTTDEDTIIEGISLT